MSKEKRLAVGSFAFAIISSLSLMIYRILFMKKYYNPYSLEYDLEAGKDIKIFGWSLFAAILAETNDRKPLLRVLLRSLRRLVFDCTCNRAHIL